MRCTTWITSRTISGAKPWEGSSRSMRRGFRRSGRAMASISCSPPDNCPASCERRACELREECENPFERPSARPGLGDHKVLEDSEAAEDLASFGDVTGAELRNAMRGPAGSVLPEDFDDAVSRGCESGNAAHQRRFAGAIVPEHGDNLAFVHLQGNAVQDVAFAVIGIGCPGL